MKKKQMDSKLALLEIETLVSNYTEIEVELFIGILCVRFMKEHKISKEELFESLSDNIVLFIILFISCLQVSKNALCKAEIRMVGYRIDQ